MLFSVSGAHFLLRNKEIRIPSGEFGTIRKKSTWHSAWCVGLQRNVIAKLMIMTTIMETEIITRHWVPNSQTHYDIYTCNWILGWVNTWLRSLWMLCSHQEALQSSYLGTSGQRSWISRECNSTWGSPDLRDKLSLRLSPQWLCVPCHAST